MSQLHFSRIQLKKESQVRAIASLLLPQKPEREILAARHKLIWSLFSDGKEHPRDFLWREDKYGKFYTLSAREPVDHHNLFDMESKPFEPILQTDDPLLFSLRANPVVSRKTEGKRRGQRHDVVMDCLSHYKEDRHKRRGECVEKAGQDWLKQQGERSGFKPEFIKVDGYHQHILPRKGGKRPGNISTLDFQGRLTVTDPEKFLAKLTNGFGSAKAFGCGLMMIKRA